MIKLPFSQASRQRNCAGNVVDHRAAPNRHRLSANTAEKAAPHFFSPLRPDNTNFLEMKSPFPEITSYRTGFPPLHMDSLSHPLPTSPLPVLQGLLQFRLWHTSTIT